MTRDIIIQNLFIFPTIYLSIYYTTFKWFYFTF